MTRLQRNKQYISDLLGVDETGTVEARRDLLLQTAALVGVDIATGLISDALKKPTKQRIEENQNAVAAPIQKSLGQAILVFNPIDELKNQVSKYGLNYLNRWSIDFGENKAIDEKEKDKKIIRELMSIYTTEVALPSQEITTSKNSLSFIANEDVSNVSHGDLTITIMLDRNLLLYDAIQNIIYKIRNPLTGRYGYKDDYKFDYIDIYINNEVNDTPLFFTYADCVLKGVSEVNLNYSPTEMKTISLTFSYAPREKLKT